MRSIAGSGHMIGRTIQYRSMRSRPSIAIGSCRSRRWDEQKPSTDYADNLCNLWILSHDHSAGAFVGENLGQQRVAFVAADDVCTVNAAFQQQDDALEFRDHPT